MILLHNTIRLTIYARRDIIEIMNLVGATARFIKRPFIIEGFLQGLFGALFATGLLHLTVMAVRRLFFSSVVFDQNIYILIVVIGAIIGMLSSWISLGKHLDHV